MSASFTKGQIAAMKAAMILSGQDGRSTQIILRQDGGGEIWDRGACAYNGAPAEESLAAWNAEGELIHPSVKDGWDDEAVREFRVSLAEAKGLLPDVSDLLAD